MARRLKVTGGFENGLLIVVEGVEYELNLEAHFLHDHDCTKCHLIQICTPKLKKICNQYKGYYTLKLKI